MELQLEASAVLLHENRGAMQGNAQDLIKNIIPNTELQALCKSDLITD